MNEPVDSPVVVVGAGLAGSRTCLELRKIGYGGRIVLLGEETSPPYDRPPLSKAVIAGRRESKPLKADYEELGIELRLGTRVESADLARREVVTGDGPIGFGKLVVASGAAPVRLPGAGEQLTLRTDADAAALRDRLVEGARVVVVGASWIGAEVAHAALRKGCTVTGLEFHPAPLSQALGAVVGARFAGWWEGATLRTSTRVTAVEPDGVHLEGGEVVPADVVVTGIGVRAATDWLRGCGLELLPAVAVDERLRTADADVYALGDAAAWWSPRFGRRMDVQHWDDAYTAPAVVASGIVHGDAARLAHDPVPYFWSDQFGHRIEYVGHHDPGDTMTIDDGYEKGWTVRWTDPAGRLTAALGVDQSKLVAAWRKDVLAGEPAA
ncbi:NAD(P)/FAD-dependent oxidoreductase [Amycolatopsis sp. FDAARGOS 1241]|uniref:NAD(P)/FAD-dependent oxidoreductase n=1 Tax=Amycolatopsis sp. FDAARGOS 1241 TaxID=2778070 RepID=UPI001950332F|nr:FAD-dependent oxidoreductase [Amycolatopsis sp. FDAARGOS 1241]QRP42869.1 FAD-dependent oxidoreductase [Amycolatopsis sp. FDAARGOS 1241]